MIVCATNGIASSDLKTIRFTISTPFWRSVWFILLCFVIFLLSVFVIVKRIIAKNKLSIERKNKLVSLELATLKSQLNPHFIFNSLNNIQYLVFQKDEEKTSEYISSFSNLMRGVLNNSRNAFISLKDEIDFLTNYVNIQSMKLKDEISLNINYEDIDINETWIRSMILQPFVENSVIHGLTLKEGTKKISINFRLIDNILEVDIIDNGIGRKAANKFKEQSSIKLKSISTSIIKEKGHILNKFFNEELVFEYEDLFDGDSVLGTKVLLRMNYKMGDLN